MNVLKGMDAFAQVAKHGSFAEAARAMGLSKSVVNRQVIELEQWLGMELMMRTTRSLTLTEQGEEYLERCAEILDQVDELRELAGQSTAKPSGTIRVTAPTFFSKECLPPLLPGYLTEYPEVQVSLVAVDRFVDLVEEGYDVALRIGQLADSSLVARKLMKVKLVAVASPGYLKEHGRPRVPAELKTHNCIVDTVAHFKGRWPLKSGRQKQIEVSGNVEVNGGELARDLAIQGVGIALLPRLIVARDLKRGALTTVLGRHIDFEANLYAVYSRRRHPSPKVRSFIDYIVGRLRVG